MSMERHINRSHSEKNTNRMEITSPQPAKPWRNPALLGVALTGALLVAQSAKAEDSTRPGDIAAQAPRTEGGTRLGDIFVIALENHNFTQPNPTNSPQQIFGNPAAPYINSLITSGNSNAVQVSFATAYYNDGVGVHPSEPNYVWAEAGTDFGFHSDADPNPANGNTFYQNSLNLVSQIITPSGSNVVFWHRNNTPHLTGQLNAAGVPWKNYQEDVELSASPTNSASGTNGPVNPYNGTTEYNYAVKHNPMAFFNDTAEVNVYPLAQLFTDLTDNTVGRYNWITPDQYNDAHSSLTGGFTYQSVHYTGDQSAIAAADNFLSIVVPQIMASKAYQDNGAIILWWDETEDGDSTAFTVPEIIISPLAKGNAYASAVPLSHSSDVKTVEEIYHLSQVNNPIPANETNSEGGFNNVATVNDLSDLFVPGLISSNNLAVTYGAFVPNFKTNMVWQVVRVTNEGTAPVSGPLWLVLDNLSANATLLNSEGTTAVLAPLGSPYVQVPIGFSAAGSLFPGETATVTLAFSGPGNAAVTYNPRVLTVTPAP